LNFNLRSREPAIRYIFYGCAAPQKDTAAIRARHPRKRQNQDKVYTSLFLKPIFFPKKTVTI